MDASKMNRAQRRAQEKRQGSSRKKRKVIASSGALLGMGASLVPLTPAGADTTFVVTASGDATADDGELTLREAVQQANDTPGLDTITFDLEGGSTISLLDGAIGITEALYINGPGLGALTIDGGYLDRIFYSGTGELGAPTADVTIEGLTLINGAVDFDDDPGDSSGDSEDRGGAINMIGGSLTLEQVRIADSHADVGGAIALAGSGLTINGSQIESNAADRTGGGIWATDVTGDVVIANSIVSGNEIVGNDEPYYCDYRPAPYYDCDPATSKPASYEGDDGGGIFVSSVGGDLTLTGTAVEYNVAQRDGGGIHFSSIGGESGQPSGDLVIVGGTIGSNEAGQYLSGEGGGVWFSSPSGDLSISGNTSVEYNDAGKYGGGAHVESGSVTISDGTTFSYNEAKYGGGLSSDTEDVSITGSGFVGNFAYEGGGAVSVRGEGGEGGIELLAVGDGMTIEDSYLTGNSALEDGGAVMVVGLEGSLEIFDTTIDGNSAGSNGGGLLLAVLDDYAEVTVGRTTISGNTAGEDGGGAFVYDDGYGTVLFVNSTVSGNSAGDDGGGIWMNGFGGGYATAASDVEAATYLGEFPPIPVVYFSTITGNIVGGEGGSGGGIYLDNGSAYVVNSVLANSEYNGGGVASDIGGEGTLLTVHSLIENTTAGSYEDLTGTIVDTDPMLGPLADNGGETLTHLPAAGSPLIDGGDTSSEAPVPPTDQRHAARVRGLAADIGSVETAPPGGGGGGGGAPAPAGATVEFSGDVTVDEDSGSGTVTVIRSGSTTGTSTVQYATSHGLNVSSDDYTATSGTLTFGPGETSKTFVVPITDDDVDEPDEVITVTLSDPTPAQTTLGASSTASVTIVDDDGNLVCADPARSGFEDVPGTNVHSAAIDCLLAIGVTTGTTADTFSPRDEVTRGQMASFIARAIEHAGGTLPTSVADAFDDDDGTFHEARINQLAAVGIVDGFADGTYREGANVTRGQMAKFLANTYAYITGEELTSTTDHFDDDDGTEHEADINKIAEAMIAQGFGDGTYGPGLNVRRDQMASFLVRLLIEVEEHSQS